MRRANVLFKTQSFRPVYEVKLTIIAIWMSEVNRWVHLTSLCLPSLLSAPFPLMSRGGSDLNSPTVMNIYLLSSYVKGLAWSQVADQTQPSASCPQMWSGNMSGLNHQTKQVNTRSRNITSTQPRPESPVVTLAWHASKCMACKLIGTSVHHNHHYHFRLCPQMPRGVPGLDSS